MLLTEVMSGRRGRTAGAIGITTGPPARAAMGGPCPNRPAGEGFGRRGVLSRREEM